MSLIYLRSCYLHFDITDIFACFCVAECSPGNTQKDELVTAQLFDIMFHNFSTDFPKLFHTDFFEVLHEKMNYYIVLLK